MGCPPGQVDYGNGCEDDLTGFSSRGIFNIDLSKVNLRGAGSADPDAGGGTSGGVFVPVKRDLPVGDHSPDYYGQQPFGPYLTDGQRGKIDWNNLLQSLGIKDDDDLAKFLADLDATNKDIDNQFLKWNDELQRGAIWRAEHQPELQGFVGTTKDPNYHGRLASSDKSHPCPDYISGEAPPPPSQQPNANLQDYGNRGSQYKSDPALNQQWQQLKTERYLAAMMKQDEPGAAWWPSNGNIFGDDIRNALAMGMDRESAVKYALSQELGANARDLNLDNDLINLLFDAFSNPNEDDVDWQGLANYLQEKADCDAKLLQKAAIDKKMANGGHPGSVGGCGDDIQQQYDDLAKACRDCQQNLQQKPQTRKLPPGGPRGVTGAQFTAPAPGQKVTGSNKTSAANKSNRTQLTKIDFHAKAEWQNTTPITISRSSNFQGIPNLSDKTKLVGRLQPAQKLPQNFFANLANTKGLAKASNPSVSTGTAHPHIITQQKVLEQLSKATSGQILRAGPGPSETMRIIDDVLQKLSGIQLLIQMHLAQALLQALGATNQDNIIEALDKLKDGLDDLMGATEDDISELLAAITDEGFLDTSEVGLPYWKQQEYDDIKKLYEKLNKWWRDHHNGKDYPDG